MKVRRAVPGDERLVRSVRLEAIADVPDAFEATPGEERARALPDWRRWLTRGATFLLVQGGAAKGMAAGIPHADDPRSVFLESVWVDPDLRGTGAAGDLVAAVLSWAKGEGMEAAWLHVGRENRRARGFYEKCGFLSTGREVVRERDGLVEIEMRLSLVEDGG